MGDSRWLFVFVLGTAGCRIAVGEQPRPSEASVATTQSAEQDDWAAGRLPPTDPLAVPRRGGRVVVQITSDPPSLNPIVDSDWTASRIVLHRLYQSLIKDDPRDAPRYRMVPELAERWEVSPDGKSYTFHLRRDVRWHDGHPFTAQDVIATFDKVQDPQTKALHLRSYTRDLSSYRALDDFTVRFELTQPYFLSLDGIFASVPIQPAHVLRGLTGAQYNDASTNPLNRHPIGTGPFRFVEWQAGQRIVLERFEHYWGRSPWLDRVLFRVVKDPAVALELAGRGELDVLGVTAEQWWTMNSPALRQNFHRELDYGNNYSWIGWNEQRPFFAGAEVRRALTMLVDRPGLIGGLLHGLARPTTCHFYWASNACDPSLTPLPYAPPRALALLSEAGWRDHDGDGILDKGSVPFRFGLMIPASSPEAAKMATKLKEDFGRAGIDLRLQRVEWSIFVRRLRTHDFDACTLAWADSGPRGDPTQIWHSSSREGGSNYVGFDNREADLLMDEARGTLDDERRDALYRRLGALLHREQPYTWLYVRPRLTLLRRSVHGAYTSLAGWQPEEWWVDDGTQEVGR